jgi:bifunctional non-homologous end joining protein LigD
MASTTAIEIAGMRLTSPDRIVYPDVGMTKRELAEYYVGVAPRMLPHVVDRPLTMVRCPDGHGGQCFFQKHWTVSLPDGLGIVQITDNGDEPEPYVYVRDVRGLVALVQYGVLEMHLWGSRVDDVETPDRVVFDLDPAPDVPWTQTLATARRTRKILASCGLESWLKTSGGKGLHVTVPIGRHGTWSDIHKFASLVTARLLEEDPEGLVDVATKAARPGRIYVDYQRNARGATVVAPWSTRARDGAPVSVPVPWTRAGTLLSGNAFGAADALRYAKRTRTDPWAAMRTSRQRLTAKVIDALMAHHTR